MSAEARLKEFGLVLPVLAKPVANYLPYRLAGDLLFLSGQGPRDEQGRMLIGKLGAEISVEEGYRRARLVGLGLLAAMREALGSLDRVDFIVKLLGMVNAVPNFNDSPKVINGCSDLFVEYSATPVATPARLSAMSCCLTRSRSRLRASSRSSHKGAPSPEAGHPAMSIPRVTIRSLDSTRSEPGGIWRRPSRRGPWTGS